MNPKGSTPDDMLIVADTGGDLWRVFQDGTVRMIRSEDDLDDVNYILGLPSGSKRKPAGDRWRRIRYSKCGECDGAGEVPKLGDDGEPEFERDYEIDEETGRPYYNSFPVYEACEDCRAQGWTWDWTDELVVAADAAKVAA